MYFWNGFSRILRSFEALKRFIVTSSHTDFHAPSETPSPKKATLNPFSHRYQNNMQSSSSDKTIANLAKKGHSGTAGLLSEDNSCATHFFSLTTYFRLRCVAKKMRSNFRADLWSSWCLTFFS